MVFRISRLRVVGAEDAGFSNLVSTLPDGAETCLYCGRCSRDSLAMVLLANESDDNPLTLYTVVCSMCSTVPPTDQGSYLSTEPIRPSPARVARYCLPSICSS